jgi:hypothetical protein
MTLLGAGFESLRAREACLQGKVFGRNGRWRTGDGGGWDLILFAFVFGAAALLSFFFSFAPAAVAFSFNFDSMLSLTH